LSEFQYYEFQALDRPLDKAAQKELRRISTRAQITSHSLVNTYQWGDFKGDPRRLMEAWFDLFVYWANWGSRTLMLRVPRRFLDPSLVLPYVIPDVLDMWTTSNAVVLEFRSTREDPDDYPDENGLSAPMAVVRADLLSGDRRCLYLGWLMGLQDGMVDDDALEPPRPPGLAQLSGPLAAFAAFFGLDSDLLEAAAEGEDGAVTIARPKPAPDDLNEFIAGLPDAEKTALLRRVVLDQDPHVGLELRRRWSTAAEGAEQEAPAGRQRRAGSLLAAAEARAQERECLAAEREAAERLRREQLERLALQYRLDHLAGREEEAWREVEALAETKRPADYERALALLKDLKALSSRAGRPSDFQSRLHGLRVRHRRKTSLLDRIDAAGLDCSDGHGPL
jgi:hypothetical protein